MQLISFQYSGPFTLYITSDQTERYQYHRMMAVTADLS